MEFAPLQASDWAVVADNWWVLAQGLYVTVLLTVGSLALGFLAGFPAGATEVYGDGLLHSLVRGAGVLLRGTPIVVLIVLFFFGIPWPDIGSVGLGGWLLVDRFEINGQALLAATAALGFRSAAYQSQVFRGAIQSIDEGQIEAARSVGLSKLEAVRHVVFPQALRRSIPGFQNEFTIVLKDTSIAFAIGLGELLYRGYQLFLRPDVEAVAEVIIAISAIYFVLTFTTNRALDRLEARYAVPTGES
ncbi:amino acid ABC transporter permease [Natronomonas marina]|jgi:polar amino acid transport system permease protein|uniref:amino acid ABC transporter permease n=1 Tax=Natronomonas marina TaxID=2961939 RepID=UPI0020C9B01C|nr:amino acid ABC transporter permease [Natronomonas marina]